MYIYVGMYIYIYIYIYIYVHIYYTIGLRGSPRREGRCGRGLLGADAGEELQYYGYCRRGITILYNTIRRRVILLLLGADAGEE